MPLFNRLKKDPPVWNQEMSETVKRLKSIVYQLPCLGIPNPQAFMIVETNASEIGYGGILKQKFGESNEQVVRYCSDVGLNLKRNILLSKKKF